MVIRGAYRPTDDGQGPDAPFVKATVLLPRFRMFLDVDFLVDTGAESPFLSLEDLEEAGLNDEDFQQAPLHSVRGIGGEQSLHSEPAFIAFKGDDAQTFIWAGRVSIPQKSVEASGAPIPSILGRDLLNLCDLRLNWPAGLIALTPLNVDAGGHILPP